jgi:hypothetical protein
MGGAVIGFFRMSVSTVANDTSERVKRIVLHCPRLVVLLLAALLVSAAALLPGLGKEVPRLTDIVQSVDVHQSVADRHQPGTTGVPNRTECCGSWHCSASQLAILAPCLPAALFPRPVLPPKEQRIALRRDASLILEPPRSSPA